MGASKAGTPGGGSGAEADRQRRVRQAQRGGEVSGRLGPVHRLSPFCPTTAMVPHPVGSLRPPGIRHPPSRRSTLADTSGIRRRRAFLRFSLTTQRRSGSPEPSHSQQQSYPWSGTEATATPTVYPRPWRSTRTSSLRRSDGWDRGEDADRLPPGWRARPGPDRGRRGAAARRPQPPPPSPRVAVHRRPRTGARQQFGPSWRRAWSATRRRPSRGPANGHRRPSGAAWPARRPTTRAGSPPPGHMPEPRSREGSHLGRWVEPARPASAAHRSRTDSSDISASGFAAIWPATRPAAMARDRFIRGPGSRLLALRCRSRGSGSPVERPVEQRRQQLFCVATLIPP